MAEREDSTSDKVLKSCHACRAKKIRCSGYPGPCTTCIHRNTTCQFGLARRARRRPVAKGQMVNVFRLSDAEHKSEPRSPSSATNHRDHNFDRSRDLGTSQREPGLEFECHSSLYIDHLLARTALNVEKQNSRPIFGKGNGIFGENFSLTFFSEARLLSLSTRLKTNKVNELVKRGSIIINNRTNPLDQISAVTLTRNLNQHEDLDYSLARVYIKSYFDHIHPYFPFLDRLTFEKAALGPDLLHQLRRDKSWSALYHSILALGAQYQNEGNFEPGKGKSWILFAKALALFPELLIISDSILNLQAMAAMSVYALGISCLQIERVVLSEAARKVQDHSYARCLDENAYEYQKLFWTIYSLEKISSFYAGRSSVFIDSDIACPVPYVVEAVFNNFNWFLALAQHARLLSKTYRSLFSVGTAQNPMAYFMATVDQLKKELEQWWLSTPKTDKHLQGHTDFGSLGKVGTIWIQYLYHGLFIILERASLHLENWEEKSSSNPVPRSTERVMMASHSVLELTKFVDVEPYTPFWIVAGIPVAALFVLFDIVIHFPKLPQTLSNLALLDVAGGHFSRIEYASRGSLQASLIAEFASIARNYVRQVQRIDTEDEILLREVTRRCTTPQSISSPNARGLDKLPPYPVNQNHNRPASASVPNPADEQDTYASVNTQSYSEIAGAVYSHDSNEFSYLGTGSPFIATDILDLFGSALPSLDPHLWPWMTENSSNEK